MKNLTMCQHSRVITRQQQSNVRTKKLTFDECVRVQPIREKSTRMTPEEKAQVYYSRADMLTFQCQGRDICKSAAKQAKILSQCDPSINPSEHFSRMIESDPSLRGLEGIVCPTRTKYRSTVIKAVLDYQRELKALKPPLFRLQREMALSEVYSSLSTCSQILAILTAKSDTREAYDVSAKKREPSTTLITSATLSKQGSALPAVNVSIPVVSPSVENKRSLELLSNEQRQKRRRLY